MLVLRSKRILVVPHLELCAVTGTLSDTQLIAEVLVGSLGIPKLLSESEGLGGLERALGTFIVSDLLSLRVKRLHKLVD
jgi:hypothetical protein